MKELMGAIRIKVWIENRKSNNTESSIPEDSRYQWTKRDHQTVANLHRTSLSFGISRRVLSAALWSQRLKVLRVRETKCWNDFPICLTSPGGSDPLALASRAVRLFVFFKATQNESSLFDIWVQERLPRAGICEWLYPLGCFSHISLIHGPIQFSLQVITLETHLESWNVRAGRGVWDTLVQPPRFILTTDNCIPICHQRCFWHDEGY